LRAKARYEAEMIKENFSELQNEISYRVFQAYLTLKETAQNLELAKTALATAEEGVRLVQNRYENSLSPLIDLLDSQVMLDNARSNLIAKQNENRIAAVNLAFESGTIMKDFNLE
jgi:outer membrane protein